jgi:spermidine synthase
MTRLLLFSVFVIATCGLIYELVAGALASYLLGDSVTQFSTVIGAYLFSMGIGSFLSKYIQKNLVPTFIRVEILIGVVGGFSAAFLFVLFEMVTAFKLLLYGQVALTGILVGLEIPLLMRILQDDFDFKDLVSNIFTFDYIGALLASLLFPLVLVPYLGLIRTALLFGILNVAVALWAVQAFQDKLKSVASLRLTGIVALIALMAGFAYGEKILSFAENQTYPGTIVFAESSPYQRIVLSRGRDHFRLYLNGNLQFDSRDEYRYHEALVHPALAAATHPKSVLVLGGGDGLAVREILKYPTVEHITLVDLDAEVTKLFTDRPELAEMNGYAFTNPKVTVIHADAFAWLRECKEKFDFVTVDFPDPVNYSVGKLYSLSLYEALDEVMAPDAIAVVQSTSPYVAPRSFWCVDRTLREAGFYTVPYHAYVPSFGEWGYIMASHHPWRVPEKYPDGLRFVDAEMVAQMLHFPKDMLRNDIEVNRLNNQALVGYFESEWAKYDDN